MNTYKQPAEATHLIVNSGISGINLIYTYYKKSRKYGRHAECFNNLSQKWEMSDYFNIELNCIDYFQTVSR